MCTTAHNTNVTTNKQLTQRSICLYPTHPSLPCLHTHFSLSQSTDTLHWTTDTRTDCLNSAHCYSRIIKNPSKISYFSQIPRQQTITINPSDSPHLDENIHITFNIQEVQIRHFFHEKLHSNLGLTNTQLLHNNTLDIHLTHQA